MSIKRSVAAGLALVALGVRLPAGARAQNSQAPAAPPVYATLNQVMRGVQFPLSNVVFSSQGNDPAAVKPADRPSAATDLLASVFGGWQAVENSGLGLAESATLLTIPGRKCANGVAVPVQNADWIRFVQGLRDAGDAAYRAALSKNQDKMLAVSEQVAASCSNCHQVYRKAGTQADALVNRCKP